MTVPLKQFANQKKKKRKEEKKIMLWKYHNEKKMVSYIVVYACDRSWWTAHTMQVAITPSMEMNLCITTTLTHAWPLVTHRRPMLALAFLALSAVLNLHRVMEVQWQSMCFHVWMKLHIDKLWDFRGYCGFLLKLKHCIFIDIFFFPAERHDAIFVVGGLDETIVLRGMRYHPIDVETSVLRSHKKICEWYCLFLVYSYLGYSMLYKFCALHSYTLSSVCRPQSLGNYNCLWKLPADGP